MGNETQNDKPPLNRNKVVEDHTNASGTEGYAVLQNQITGEKTYAHFVNPKKIAELSGEVPEDMR